jgi:hypothetical protein
MPDHDVVAAPLADGHIAAVVSASISPILITIIIATFTVMPAAVRSDADIQLSKRDFGFRRDGIPSISGGCRKNPHCACNGGNKRQFSHY